MRDMSLEIRLKKEFKKFDIFARQMGLNLVSSSEELEKQTYMYGNYCEIIIDCHTNIFINVLQPDCVKDAVSLVSNILRKQSGRVVDMGFMFKPFFDIEYSNIKVLDRTSNEVDLLIKVREHVDVMVNSYMDNIKDIKEFSKTDLLNNINENLDRYVLSNKHVIRNINITKFDYKDVEFKDIYPNYLHRAMVIFSLCVLGLKKETKKRCITNWLLGYRHYEGESYNLINEHYRIDIEFYVHLIRHNSPLNFNVVVYKDIIC